MNDTAKTNQPPARALARARRALARDHPDVRRVTPRVTKGKQGTYTLTFDLSNTLPDGKTLRRSLRATINEEGELLRVVASR